MKALKIPDEFGYVTERARQREVFAEFIERRVDDYLSSPGGRARLAREIDSRVKAEVDALVARKTAERVSELERASMTPRGPEVRTILELVAEVTGTSVADILGPRRARNCAWPRHFATYLLHKLRKDLSSPAIARALRRSDHTTCLAALRRFELIRDEPPVDDWLADERVAPLLAAVDSEEPRVYLRALTPEQAAAVRADERSSAEIADSYGISRSHVLRIKSGECWKDAA